MAITGVNGYSSTYAQYAEPNQKNNKSVTGGRMYQIITITCRKITVQ